MFNRAPFLSMILASLFFQRKIKLKIKEDTFILLVKLKMHFKPQGSSAVDKV